jgi:hypothetical protein
VFAAILAAAMLIAVNTSAESSVGIFNVLDYGARGDGTNDDTVPIQKAVDACGEQGGGQVLLPSGKLFLSGAITLRSGIDFHLAGTAVLKGSPDWRAYGKPGALLFAKDARGLTVSGTGVLDGNDRAVWQELADEEAGGNVNKDGWWPESFTGNWWPFDKLPTQPQTHGGRPMMVIFIGCERVRLRDVTLRNAPSWTVHLVGCEEVSIDSISIRNAWDVANNDGIDIDHCRDVRVANCSIEAADDGIVIKNTPNFASYGGSARITVTGCIVASRSCALKVDEIYTQPGARDIVFADCVVSHSKATSKTSSSPISPSKHASRLTNGGAPPSPFISACSQGRHKRSWATSATSGSATFFATAKTEFSSRAGRIVPWKTLCSTTSASSWRRPAMCRGAFTICVPRECSRAFLKASWRGFMRAMSRDSHYATPRWGGGNLRIGFTVKRSTRPTSRT